MIKTLDDVNVKNKTVIMRIDLNSPFDSKNNVIKISEKFKIHAKTIKELSERGAKLVLLSHQGRKGKPSFTSLDQHAKILSDITNKEIKFVNDLVGKKAKKAIKTLKAGEVILLDNVRLLDDEVEPKSAKEHAKSTIVKNLASLSDIFVNDAFSVSHRAHASVIGFTPLLPSYAGRALEKEINSEKKAIDPKKTNIFILGGNKVEDELEVLSHLFNKNAISFVLTGGLLANTFLSAKGYALGKRSVKLLKEEHTKKAKKLLNLHKNKIILPLDVAYEKEGRKEISIEELPIKTLILDIGKRTIEKYAKIIRKADTIVYKGPLGCYEKKEFSEGTKKILEEIKKSKAFSLIGGGNTLDALKQLNFKKKDFSHISVGGGALITYLSGKEMPGIKCLES